MKVLFAVNNEKISESIIKRYQKDYKEIISSKNVYYFDAILKELQKDKSYDRIVISEDLEPFSNNNYDAIDKFIFDKLDKISDEAFNSEGLSIPIIIIGSDRRRRPEPILVRIFGIGVYDALIGQDRSVEKVCELLNKPRSKKEAKVYYKMDSDTNVEYRQENENDVSEIEIQNILAHYKKLGRNEEKYVESFDSIAVQYTDEQLKLIITFLPKSVTSVLEEKSPKYRQVMGITTNDLNQQEKKLKANKRKEQKIEFIEKELNKQKLNKPIIIPTTVDTSKVKKIVDKVAEKPVTKMQDKMEKHNLQENQSIKEKKKEQIQTQLEEGFDDIVEEPVKRKRGRPPKNKKEDLNTQENVEQPVKRKRGRPPKNKEIKEELEEKVLTDVGEDDTLLGFTNIDIEDEEEDILLPGFEEDEEEDMSLLEFEEDEEEDISLSEFEEDEEDDVSLLGFEEDEEEEDISLPGFEEDEEEEDISLPGFEEDEEDEEDDVSLPGFEEEEEDNDISLLGLEEDDEEDISLPGFEEDDDEDDDILLSGLEEDDEEDDILLSELDEEDEEDDILLTEQDENNIISAPISNPNFKRMEPLNSNSKQIENVNRFNSSVNFDIDNLISSDQKLVSFIGTSKNGTSFLVNHLAEMFSEKGINTAILDLTKNRNAYYIYTDNREELRQVAYNCIENLKNGIAQGIQVNKNLTVYTSLPDETEGLKDYENILSTLLNNYSLVLLDCDFETEYQYFNAVQEIYLVQSLDILTIQPLTAFLRELKAKNILDANKLRVVINKHMRLSNIGDKLLIGGMSSYNDPSMSFMTELFDRGTIKYVSIPFDSQVYSKYLNGLVDCKVSLKGYPKGFIQSLNKLGDMVFPLVNNKKSKGNKNNNYNNNFSNTTSNTLNKMKKNY